jgi:hypothetical protein
MGIHQRFLAETAEHFTPRVEREKRYAVATATTLITASGTSVDAQILNLSNSGCRIRSKLSVRPGEHLTFLLEPLGFVEAEVRWTCGNDMGVELVARDPSYSEYRFAYPP